MAMSKNYERAMVAAEEYREIVWREGDNSAKAREIRSTIDDLVGHYEDGKFCLPEAVREKMGLRTYSWSRCPWPQ